MSTAWGSNEQMHAAIQRFEQVSKRRHCYDAQIVSSMSYEPWKEEQGSAHHGLSFISDLGQCRAHHLIRTLIHPGLQGCLNQIGLWSPSYHTRLVATAAKTKMERERRAPACLLLRVASCPMRCCLQRCVTGSAAHLIRPIGSLRVWPWTPNSVAPLRTLSALIRQSAATRSMFDGFSHSGRMYRTWKGGFETAVFWRVLPGCRFLVFVTSAIHWRALLLLSRI